MSTIVQSRAIQRGLGSEDRPLTKELWAQVLAATERGDAGSREC